MMSAVSTTRFGCEFDRFLYASVGNDNEGMPLTVLSALARMDVDPWDEALKLTQLPQESAVRQLASLLGVLRNAPLAGLDPTRIAVPLIALLPCPNVSTPPVLKAFAQSSPKKHPLAVSTLLTILTYVIFMLLSPWLIAILQTPGPIQSPPPAASAIDSPGVSTSSEGLQTPR